MNEQTGVYGIVGLIAVFAAAGVFLTLNAPDSQVVVLEGARFIPSVSPQIPSSMAFRPFSVVGKSITGAATFYEGNATVNLNTTIDLFMNKSTITCSAELTTDASSAVLNTCNDNGGGGSATSGGAIYCDSGTSKLTLTNISACDGGFLVTNEGVGGQLRATLLANSSGPFNTISTYMYTNFTPSCSSSCNNATAASPNTLSSTAGVLCGNFTSTSAVCQCLKISITSFANIASAKSGTPILFTKNDTIVTPAQSC